MGYGAGSSFLMDFNLLSHLKLSLILYRRIGMLCEVKVMRFSS